MLFQHRIAATRKMKCRLRLKKNKKRRYGQQMSLHFNMLNFMLNLFQAFA